MTTARAMARTSLERGLSVKKGALVVRGGEGDCVQWEVRAGRGRLREKKERVSVPLEAEFSHAYRRGPLAEPVRDRDTSSQDFEEPMARPPDLVVRVNPTFSA